MEFFFLFQIEKKIYFKWKKSFFYRVSGLKVSKVIWLWQTEKIPWILIWWWILFKEGWEFMPGWSVRSPVGLCWPQWPLILQSTFPLDCLVWNTKNCKTQTASSPWFDDFFERFKILHYFPTKYCVIASDNFCPICVWHFPDFTRKPQKTEECSK